MKRLKKSSGKKQKNDLVIVCAQGKVKKVQQLLKKPTTDVNQVNEHGETALMKAAYNGHTKICKLLLQRKNIAINSTDGQGHTALFYAVAQQHFAIVKLLLEHKADPNHTKNPDKSTPLQIASDQNNLPLLQLLIQNGAKTDQLEPNKRNSIHELSHPEIAIDGAGKQMTPFMQKLAVVLTSSPEESQETGLKKLMNDIQDEQINASYGIYLELHDRVEKLK